MSDHVLGYLHVVIVLSVVDLELQPDKVGQDRCRAGLRPDGLDGLSRLAPGDGETGVVQQAAVSVCVWVCGVGWRDDFRTAQCSVLAFTLERQTCEKDENHNNNGLVHVDGRNRSWGSLGTFPHAPL